MNEQQSQHEIELLEDAVDAFAFDMKQKLAEKARQGFSGWNNPMFAGNFLAQLEHQVSRQHLDPVDIANLAMMLWWNTQDWSDLESL